MIIYNQLLLCWDPLLASVRTIQLCNYTNEITIGKMTNPMGTQYSNIRQLIWI